VDQANTWVPEGHTDAITSAVAEIVEQRAAIEQAKGILMAVYDIDAHAAFDLLRWRSQHTNTKLRLLAEQLMTDFRSLDLRTLRSTFDQLFLNAHDHVSQEWQSVSDRNPG
jgi:hypothetical protein